ncbi:MAG: hypothetical protein M3Q97_05945 [Bacteroidota bacterium]|nr:hypothetical protein [Bacteroidota bacterium]
MTYKQLGTYTISPDGLELKDFSWKIRGVRYDWLNNRAQVEVELWENHHKHVRSFDFECGTTWTEQDCLDAVLSLPQFTGSLYNTV